MVVCLAGLHIWFVIYYYTVWGPRSIAKLVNITEITMVYRWYITGGAPPCSWCNITDVKTSWICTCLNDMFNLTLVKTFDSPYLGGGLEHLLFFHSVGNFVIPADFHSIFQRGRYTNHQPDMNESCFDQHEDHMRLFWFTEVPGCFDQCAADAGVSMVRSMVSLEDEVSSEHTYSRLSSSELR